MSTMLRLMGAFLNPGGIVFLLAIAFLRPQGLPQWVQGPVQSLPLIVLAFGLFFGWYLSSSRLILSLIVLALADRAVVLFSPIDLDPLSPGPVIFSATTLLVPLDLLALSIIKEEATSTWRGVLRLLWFLSQPFLVLWLCLPEQSGFAYSLQQLMFPTLRTSWTPIPQPALIAFGGAVLLVGVRFIVQHNPLDAGVFWALIASFTAFQGLSYGWSSSNFFSAGGLTLFLTLIQASHRRVYRDELTGVLGRSAYEEAVAGLGGKYTVAVLGIDQLKQYGNRHGRSVTEQVLRLIAPKISAVSRSAKVYRLAGEEFTILFPRKTATGTVADLDAMRRSVEETTLYLCGRDRVRESRGSLHMRANDELLVVTASIGLAEAGYSSSSLSLVTRAAYRALYEAKILGGNLVKRGAVVVDVPKLSTVETGHIVAYSEFES